MASGTHHHQHHHQQQQQQQQQHHQHQQHLMQHQQSNQMQFAPSHPSNLGATNFDQQQHLHQHNTMSPSSTPMSINNTPGNIITINHHQHHQQLMGTIVGSNMGPSGGNQATNHIQQQHQQQKSQILPLLLSPRPSSLTPTSNDRLEMSADDHDRIIDQVIGIDSNYSDNSGMLGNIESGTGMMMNNQNHQHNLGDMNLSSGISLPDSNQFSSSSEDLLNLLLEFDREPSNLIGLGSSQQLDQDEKVGIENIRKQLMSCEMQSENHNTNSMSPVVNNQMSCHTQQQRVIQQDQQHAQARNQQQVTQIISQSAPVIPHHQLSTTGTPQQQQQLSADQSMMHSSYSNVPMSTAPVSSSGQPFAPQQQQQHVSRISQSNPMSIVNNSPSPSWQQPQLSPYSPQPPHNNTRTSSQRQGHQQHHQIHHPQQQQQQHSIQQHQTTTSPQMQQLHHTLQQRSPSQSLSPPLTTEPSPVVKKNPLLNAQLVNTRAPSITPTRFMNNQASVLNQNPILNAKLSQGPFVSNSGNIVGSPVNQQSRFIQQTTQQSNFSYEMPQQQQQQQNAHQHTPQQSGQINMFGSDQQQQSGNQIFRPNSATGEGASISMGTTSPSGGLSQQVKQEIRRKVLPKQQQQQHHQTTSLLKQLLSDDNK